MYCPHHVVYKGLWNSPSQICTRVFNIAWSNAEYSDILRQPEVLITIVWNKISRDFNNCNHVLMFGSRSYIKIRGSDWRWSIQRYIATPTDAHELKWWQKNRKYVRFENEPDVWLAAVCGNRQGDIENTGTATGIASTSCCKRKLLLLQVCQSCQFGLRSYNVWPTTAALPPLNLQTQKHRKRHQGHVCFTFLYEIRGLNILAWLLSVILDLIMRRTSDDHGSYSAVLFDLENMNRNNKTLSVHIFHQR
jgi:hypothetical protein